MGASVKPAARRNARQFALQAIYSWQITKENVATIEEQFLTSGKYDEEEHRAAEPALAAPETDVSYFRDLLAVWFNTTMNSTANCVLLFLVRCKIWT